MLEGTQRVFVKISKEMEAAGFVKTAEQCSSKIKKLKFEYRKIKDKHGKTGEGRKDWRLYEAMDEVLGHKPATHPPVVVESGGTVDVLNENDDDDPIDEEQSTWSSERADTSSSSSSQGKEISTSRSSTPNNMNTDKTPTNKGKNKKRKRVNDNFDKMEGLVGKLVKMQEESEKNYMRL